MRQVVKLPRILKINSIKGLVISVVFNNGESRIIDFKKNFYDVLKDKNSPASKLLNPVSFRKVKLSNDTLSWQNVEQYIQFKNKRVKVPFEMGADTLYAASEPDPKATKLSIGSQIKSARVKEGLTQIQLAQRSGTSRSYISRIENNESGIEMSTLEKIVEVGLGKQLEVKIKS